MTKIEDLMIIYDGENRYMISMRIRFLFFFYRWVPVTYQEAEHLDDYPIMFGTLNGP